MRKRFPMLALAASLLTSPAIGQEDQPSPATRHAPPAGPIRGALFDTQYIRLARDSEGLLYTPKTIGPKARIALVFAHPDNNVFSEAPGRELASRGYRVFMVNYRGKGDTDEDDLPTISRGIQYLRTIPGVEKVLVVGHSGGGHLIPFYQNVAENGSAVCRRPGMVYQCSAKLDGLAKADGMVLLDPTFGAFHQASSVDPAVTPNGRDASLDMFAPANGYDLATRSGHYSADFAKRFYAAQAKRNDAIVADADARLAAIESGKGKFSDDEPMLIRGMGVLAAGARLYQADTTLQSHTKVPHLLLKADGTNVTTIIHSVRPPSGKEAVGHLDSLAVMNQNTTVRKFLAESAIRITPGYAMTDDDVKGVDWGSAMTSSPFNAEGITVPSLVLTMSCHYLVVPGEIIFNHLRATDKTYASVEGAVHVFTPCGPQYGDTVKRTFDFVDQWLSAKGRF